MMEYRIAYEEKSWDELSVSQRELLQMAGEAAAKAYAPYSGFGVGAAARLSDGTIRTASNQESVSFPAGLCAERALLFGVLQQPGVRIEAVAVAARRDGTNADVSPCGICRQTLLDAERRQGCPLSLIFRRDAKYVVVASAADLLPFGFGM